MFAKRAIGALHGDYDLLFTRLDGGLIESLLIFGPKPGQDRFFHVVEGFFVVFSLGNAAGQSRALSDNPSIFGVLKRNVKQRRLLLESAIPIMLIICESCGGVH